MDPGEFALYSLGQRERVEASPQFLEGADLGQITLATGDEAVQRGLRLVVDALQPGAEADFLDQLHRGLEEVHDQAPHVSVENVDGRERLLGIVAVPAQQFADMD
jgi:hypothetical protein